MGDLIAALILGAVQGATEWLPISSEGVLTLIQLHLWGRPFGTAISFAIWLHLGTLIAAIVYFRHELLRLLASLRDWVLRRPQLAPIERGFLSYLLIATLITALVGAPLLALSLQAQLISVLATVLIGTLLIITGLIQRYAPRLGRRTLAHLSWRDAVWVGLAQGLAAMPGLSRSGLTIAALLLRGYEETAALRISFIMSIPVIFGAQFLLELLALADATGEASVGWHAALAGVFSAAIVGWLTIAALMRLALRLPFWAFAIALGALSLIAALFIS